MPKKTPIAVASTFCPLCKARRANQRSRLKQATARAYTDGVEATTREWRERYGTVAEEARVLRGHFERLERLCDDYERQRKYVDAVRLQYETLLRVSQTLADALTRLVAPSSAVADVAVLPSDASVA